MAKASALVIVLGVIAVAVVGGHFSMMNRDWYEALNRPAWQPPNWLFGPVWTTIFILTAISLILILNAKPTASVTYVIIGVAILNGILNVAWSALFFGNKLIVPAMYDAGLLCASVIFIMVAAWPISRAGSLLLAPYAIWTAFATYLTWTIHRLNP